MSVRNAGSYPNATFYDMHFSDFVTDQFAVVSDIYAALGLPMSDLFADAAMRVQLARSAGVALPDETSALHRSSDGVSVQLRYRSEMADVFIDLAIDVGLRDAESLAETGA